MLGLSILCLELTYRLPQLSFSNVRFVVILIYKDNLSNTIFARKNLDMLSRRVLLLFTNVLLTFY